MKTDNNFSNEIIISDVPDFNPSLIRHSEYSIKIAMIKDNPDKWINSYLDEYDYIFTLDNNYNALNKNKSCYILNGETVYQQITYILNKLYKTKSDKFYFLLKNLKLDNIFPKYKDYFKVLNSEYFDEEWYKKTYDIPDNTDPVIHFLLVGFNKGYNPSPNFSIDEYYTCNYDVRKAGLNPLIHYESYGKKENRIIHISDMNKRYYSIISDSPYFDKEWYERTYDIHDDCVDHYLNIGFKEWYDPGPNFSTFEYYYINRDIKKIRMNPLVHYEMYGKKENRKINLPDDKYETHRSAVLNSPYFDKEWYERTYDIHDMDCVDHYWKIGFAKGYNPSPDFSTNEYYQCNPDVQEFGLNPLVHYEMYGRKEGRKLGGC